MLSVSMSHVHHCKAINIYGQVPLYQLPADKNLVCVQEKCEKIPRCSIPDSEVSQVSHDSSSTVSESGTPGSQHLATQPRTLTSVLKRLSNILDRRSQVRRQFKEKFNPEIARISILIYTKQRRHFCCEK